MIAENDLSFVVQGPIIKSGANATSIVLESIRNCFPTSEIILSTWIDEEVEGLKYDKIVLSEPPPSITLYANHQCNINKQIVSTLEGIKVVSRTYIVKTRTNTVFSNNNLLTVFKNVRINSVFENTVFTINLFSRDQYKSSVISYYDGFLHHPSDIFLIGLKKDILNFFSCPLASKKIMLNRDGLGILTPEQYLWMDLLIRTGHLKNFKNSLVRYNPLSCFKSEKLLFSNFKIVNFEAMGLKLENRIVKGWMPDSVIDETFQDWLDSKSDWQKNLIFTRRAVYYCLIVNHFWRKLDLSLKRKRKKYKYLFICRR